MMRKIGTLLTFLSVMFFPWPLTAGIALGVAAYEPLVPFAAGLFADTLYYIPHYIPHDGSLPLFTIFGALVTAAVFFVRSQLKAGLVR